MKEKYGILNGDEATDLMRNIISAFVRESNPRLVEEPAIVAAQIIDTSPTQRYQNAVVAFLDNNDPRPSESSEEADARLARKVAAQAIISEELQQSLTAVNKYYAALRAITRIDNARTSDRGVFTEEILRRFNDREMLSYAIVANLDINEIKYNLDEAKIPKTPRNIFMRQKENIENLINNLGQAQRAYNMEVGGGLVDTGGIPQAILAGNPRGARDSQSCAHGFCTRIIDSVS